MPLGDPVAVHARYIVYGVPGDASLEEVVEIMADRGVRRLRVYMGSGHAYVTARGVVYTIDSIKNAERLARLRATLLPLEYPPVIDGGITVREVARVMASRGSSFVEVSMGSELGVFTVADLLRSIEPGEMDEPVVAVMTPGYPSVEPGSRLVDAVHQMRIHGVDSVLVMHDGEMAGILDSRTLLEALSIRGFEVLDEPVYREAERVRCILGASQSLGEAAAMMASTGSSICVVAARGYIVGIVDEILVLEAVAGSARRLPRLLARAPPV
ncbi:MAG: CBS domain-containing protein [Desulfurococcales archaeon]|nr:CBS domain-containing protein [Desulfurococcales archaeon]